LHEDIAGRIHEHLVVEARQRRRVSAEGGFATLWSLSLEGAGSIRHHKAFARATSDPPRVRLALLSVWLNALDR
jgi:hypothetical protein